MTTSPSESDPPPAAAPRPPAPRRGSRSGPAAVLLALGALLLAGFSLYGYLRVLLNGDRVGLPQLLPLAAAGVLALLAQRQMPRHASWRLATNGVLVWLVVGLASLPLQWWMHNRTQRQIATLNAHLAELEATRLKLVQDALATFDSLESEDERIGFIVIVAGDGELDNVSFSRDLLEHATNPQLVAGLLVTLRAATGLDLEVSPMAYARAEPAARQGILDSLDAWLAVQPETAPAPDPDGLLPPDAASLPLLDSPPALPDTAAPAAVAD